VGRAFAIFQTGLSIDTNDTEKICEGFLILLLIRFTWPNTSGEGGEIR